MPLFLSPVCNDQTFDANGDPLTGGQIETYLAGSSTPAATYTDDSGGTPQSNPIILNSLGYPTLGSIWLTGGNGGYKFVIKNAAGAILRTIDDIVGVNDTASSQSEWVESGLVPTYIGATSFSVPGDQTATLQVNRRLRTQNTSGFVYSTISNSVFAAGITTVTVVNDGVTVLDAGLSSVAYGLLAATPSSIPAIQTAGIADKAVTFAKIQDIPTNVFVGRQTAGSGSMETRTPAQVVPLLTDKLQPINATVNGTGGAPSNGVRITLNPTTLDFRDSSLASGSVTTVNLAAAVTADISSGSTLGFSNGVLGQVNVYAMNNGGTIELAYVNAAGGLNLNETGLMSTTAEGGAGGADSATTIYSTTARSNLPYRFVGVWQATEATAGTWVTPPSLIQGAGGLVTADFPLHTLMTPISLNGLTVAEFNFVGVVEEATVLLNAPSLSGTDNFLIQLRTTAGWETTGYAGSSGMAVNAAASVGVTSVAGFPIVNNVAANLTTGRIVLSLFDSTNLWIAGGTSNIEGSAVGIVTSGRKGMPGAVTGVRLAASGANTFDAGSVNVSYRRRA